MPRELTQAEKAAFIERHPEFTLEGGGYEIPEDGVIVKNTLGCVFLFDKQDGTRIFALVNDIWPTCTRQIIPTPPSILDELLAFVGEARTRTEQLITAAAWILIGVLILQSGVLQRVFAKT